MFHVEHMILKIFMPFLVLFFLSACTKADPEAYKTDPILHDYQAQQGALSSQLESIAKQIETTEKDLKSSVPQSGQSSIHQKKLNQLHEQSRKLAQQIQFWKIRIESRAKEAQAEYLEAYKNKKEWPDKNRVQAYFAEKRLRISKMQWDQKSRIENYKKGSSNAPAGNVESSHTEE